MVWGKEQRTYQGPVLNKNTNPCIKGEARANPYLMIHAGKPIGYLQTYRISDHPGYNAHVGVNSDTAGVDLFIGEADYLPSRALYRHLAQVHSRGDLFR